MLGFNFTHSNCRKWTPCADISCHYLPGVRIGYPRMALPRPLPPTISVGGSGSFHLPRPCLPLSQWEAQAFRCFRLPLPLPPTISVEAQAFRCFRLPLPLPPTISAGSSGLPLLPPSAARASHYLSGRLRPSAFRCPRLPLSQWEARAPSVCWLDTPGMPECGA